MIENIVQYKGHILTIDGNIRKSADYFFRYIKKNIFYQP